MKYKWFSLTNKNLLLEDKMPQSASTNLDFMTLFQGLPAPYLLLSPDEQYVILGANEYYLNKTGKKKEDILNKPIFVVFPHIDDEKTDTKALRGSLDIVRKTKESHVMAPIRYDINEKLSYWTVTNFPVMKNGQVVCIVNCARDITEETLLKQQHKIELESLDAYKLAFANAPVGIAKVALNGKFLQANTVFCNLVGRTNEELITMDFQSITHADDLAEDVENVRKCLTKEQNEYNMEKRYVRKNGESIWVRLHVKILNDYENKPLQFIAYASDISESKKIKQQLEQTMERLSRNNEDLEHFAYVASHDLQEPLRTVNSYVQLFAVKYKDQVDEKGKQYITYISEATMRLRDLIRNLLDYSRSSKETVKEKTSFHEVLSEAIQGLKLKINTSKAKIIYDRWNDTPINGNILEISRVFQNLISNSLKFTPQDRKPQIKIAYEKGNGFTTFSVKDNGIGISKDNFENLFKMFYRVREAATNTEGTGIGLAICKRIVEKHGGRIFVESTPGQGAKFSFTLPD